MISRIADFINRYPPLAGGDGQKMTEKDTATLLEEWAVNGQFLNKDLQKVAKELRNLTAEVARLTAELASVHAEYTCARKLLMERANDIVQLEAAMDEGAERWTKEVASARAVALKEAEAIARQWLPYAGETMTIRPPSYVEIADVIAALAKEPAPDLTSPSQSAIIQGE